MSKNRKVEGCRNGCGILLYVIPKRKRETTDNDPNLQRGNFDELLGLDGNDILTGDERANRLDGRDGQDELSGEGGADTLHGGGGHDILEGGDRNDDLDGVTITG